jgi:hypothetical protein
VFARKCQENAIRDNSKFYRNTVSALHQKSAFIQDEYYIVHLNRQVDFFIIHFHNQL